MEELLADIRKCKICLPHLKDGVNPVLSAHKESKIAIIGQAPGKIVHQSGKPWDDKSGDRLREWLNVDKSTFYSPEIFAIIPMGFCYPGKGKSGDLPPRKECATAWHASLFNEIKNLELILLIGSYAQAEYLREKCQRTLTETVRNYKAYLPKYFVLPHPSPRNNIWLKKNPWFEAKVMIELKNSIQKIIYK